MNEFKLKPVYSIEEIANEFGLHDFILKKFDINWIKRIIFIEAIDLEEHYYAKIEVHPFISINCEINVDDINEEIILAFDNFNEGNILKVYTTSNSSFEIKYESGKAVVQRMDDFDTL
jgi:hypothetical protein